MRTPIAAVDGALLLAPEMHPDERGFFCELDVPRFFGTSRWCVARSRRGVIRGLHVRPGGPQQLLGEAKVVRCSAGAAWDVIVDLRRGSPTYRQWAGVRLDGASQVAVYIPSGCAHGYQALEDNTDMTYRIDAERKPDGDVLIAWNDPELAIEWWPLHPVLMTERDRNAPTLAEVEEALGEL